MHQKVNLGIIGCGRQASKLVIAFSELNYFNIVALCDLDPSNFEVFLDYCEKRENVQLTDDYKSLIDNPNVDAVIITTPTYLHLEPAHYALEKEKDIFIEKPLGLDLESIDKFIVKAAKSKSIVQVGFPYHHAYYFQTIQNILREDFYGGCKHILVQEHRFPFLGDWFFDKSKSGGAVNDKLIHYFDISNTTFSGSKPAKVYATGSQHFYHKKMHIEGVSSSKFLVENPDIVDNATVIVEYENHELLTVSMNMYQRPPVQGTSMHFTSLKGEHISVSGDGYDITIRMRDEHNKLHNFKMKNREDNDSSGINHPGGKEEFRQFYYSIIKRKQPEANLYYARNAQIIALAAERSIIEGKPIMLAEYYSTEIEKLAKDKKWTQPSDFKRYYMVDVDKVNLNKKKDWLERLYLNARKLYPQKSSLKYRKLNRNLVNRILNLINKDKVLKKKLMDLNCVIGINLPWYKFAIGFLNGEAYMLEGTVKADLDTVFTKEGFEGILSNASVVQLYLNREIGVSGDFKMLQTDRAALFGIVEYLKQVCIIN